MVSNVSFPARGGGKKEKVSIVLRHNLFFNGLRSVKFTDGSTAFFRRACGERPHEQIYFFQTQQPYKEDER
ncbi:MAG: hypothetical protein LBR79_05485 [Oscillospiraceae bacterium]|nr:hypothetical protein [Oscillospiraceae bacterium]